MKAYQKIKIEDSKRLFIVADLHGDYDLYLKGCEDLGITKDDVVISLGDRTDRKHKNFACVAEFHNKENRYAILGNHCDLMVKGFLEGSREHFHCFYQNGGNTTMDEVGEQGCYLLAEMMKDSPVILEVEYQGMNLGFVHGGIPNLKFNESWDTIVSQAVKSDKYKEELVWDRSVIQAIQHNMDSGVEIYNVQPVDGVDYVFHGHSPIKQEIVYGNRVYMDLGAFFSGKLCFGYFEDKQLKFYKTGDFDGI